VTRRSFLVLAALPVAAFGFTGCFGENGAGVLLDGTPAREAPVELEGINGTTVLTATSVLSVTSLEPGSAAHTCIEEHIPDAQFEGSAVLRVGIASESLTVREAGGRSLRGCVNTAGPREGRRRWCSGSSGRLRAGRLDDPRLELLCTTSGGMPVAFAWFDVSENTRYLAVRQPDYVEVYEVAGGVPVRVATVSEVEGSQATFDLSEHDAEGRLLSRDRVEAFVAG
jgi:hypothetical protein